MAKKKVSRSRASDGDGGAAVSCGIERLLLAASDRGDESLQTGRYIVSFRGDGADGGAHSLMSASGLSVADTRDFAGQEFQPEDLGDADALVFGEIGSALVSAEAMESMGLASMVASGGDSGDGPVEAIEPEYFVFSEGGEYLRGFLAASNAIARDLGDAMPPSDEDAEDVDAEALGATYGLKLCKVPPSSRSGAGIRVAVLDTGMDLKHPDFKGRKCTAKSFVGQPVQDLHSHGTHCIGTACGPKAPAGSTPRYGIGYGTHIFVGKVLTNSGSGSTASVLAGMNWAIANKCQVISMSLGSQSGVQLAYTLAGGVALAKGCLIIAAAGNAASQTGAPANSPTIMSVASLDPNCKPSSFSNRGKIEIAAPGRDVYSSVPMPQRYGYKSGTSMACPHVAGCAALWAQSSSSLRGLTLWKKLQSTAKKLPFPASKVGAGLVQAP